MRSDEIREDLRTRLFPEGVPLLWCPPLTHYQRQGGVDGARILAHLRHLAPHAKGLLVPGSTGDGWEMDPEESRQVLGLALEQAQRLGLHVLIGVLKTEAQAALETIWDRMNWLKTLTNERDPEAALAKARVCGFTVCPPRGRDLSQAEIGKALTAILETGLPVALYQLPQVTQNQMGAELATELANRFGNFLLFKDSSGADRVALSAKGLKGVFALRGAEGDYARWLNPGGGPYNGFLLGSANCFAAQLAQIIRDVSAGRKEEAGQMSARLTAVVNEVSRLAAALPDGNPFANANKALDHFMAYGPKAADAPPPRLHAGGALPLSILTAAGDLLSRHGLMPAKGYLEK